MGKAADWVDEVNQAESLDELDDTLARYTESGADFKSVEDAVEKKRAELSGEAPDEGDDSGDDGEGDGRAKLAMADPSAGMTPDPDAVEAAEAELPEVDPDAEPVEDDGGKVLLLPGTWVILADTENVPEEVVGHEACITVAPAKVSDGDEQIPFRHQYQDEDTRFTVQTRDMYSATIPNLTVDDFEVVSTNGRTGLVSAG